MRKVKGMTAKQWKALNKVMTFKVTPSAYSLKSVEQAINDGDVDVISIRISKRGVELVKLSNGKEFEKKNLASTTYFA